MAAYDAVLLDLDGTLCEYVRTKVDLLSAAFEAVGVDPLFHAAAYEARVDSYADQADSMFERRRLCFADLAAENGHDPEIGRAVADAYAEDRDHSNVRPLDGAQDALAWLEERYPLALVTNGGPDMQDPKIDAIGLRDRVGPIVYAGSDGVPAKPDPEPFQRALRSLEVSADRALYVGNNYETDVVGAVEAGLDAVLVGEMPADGPIEPVAAIDQPGSLPDVL